MAGIVLVEKFIQPGANAYRGYVEYIDRPEAIRDIKELREYDVFGTYQDYMDNPEKSTGLFNEKDNITDDEKQELKNIFDSSQKKGSLLFQTVISFEPEFLEINGIMDDDGYVHEDILKDYTRTAVAAIQEKENMQGFVWMAAIHHNTDNAHIHIAMVDPDPSWVLGEGRCCVNARGELYQRGKWRKSTMEAAKSRIVNKALSLSDANKQINEIMRQRIIFESRKDRFNRRNDPEIEKAFISLLQQLPGDMRLWKYGNNAMKPYISHIDDISDIVIEKYFKDDMEELNSMLEDISGKYEAAYGSNKNGRRFKENKITDMYYRMGNAVLTECRKIEHEKRKKVFKDKAKNTGKIRTRTYTGAALNSAVNTLKKVFRKDIQSMKNQAIYRKTQTDIENTLE